MPSRQSAGMPSIARERSITSASRAFGALARWLRPSSAPEARPASSRDAWRRGRRRSATSITKNASKVRISISRSKPSRIIGSPVDWPPAQWAQPSRNVPFANNCGNPRSRATLTRVSA